MKTNHFALDAGAGAVAAAAAAAELMAAGWLERRSPWAPINAIAPLLLRKGGDERLFHPKITLVGGAILMGGIFGVAATANHLGRSSPSHAPFAALAAGAGLALVDYVLLPKARRPAFGEWLSRPSIAGKYVTVAVVVGISALISSRVLAAEGRPVTTTRRRRRR